MTLNKFSDWLNREYLKWQLDSGGKKTVGEFSEYLGLSRNVLNNYMNRGQKPDPANLDKLAEKLGDGVYEVLKVEPPPPIIRFAKYLLPLLNDEDKEVLLRDL